MPRKKTEPWSQNYVQRIQSPRVYEVTFADIAAPKSSRKNLTGLLRQLASNAIRSRPMRLPRILVFRTAQAIIASECILIRVFAISSGRNGARNRKMKHAGTRSAPAVLTALISGATPDNTQRTGSCPAYRERPHTRHRLGFPHRRGHHRRASAHHGTEGPCAHR